MGNFIVGAAAHRAIVALDREAVTAGALSRAPMRIAKAITVRARPALDVMFAGKRLENRTWSTRYRGPLYLHVSAKEMPRRHVSEDISELCDLYGIREIPRKLEGYLVGTMNLVECTRKTPPGQRRWSQPGHWHFILSNVKLLRTPIKMPGQLGIWNVKRRVR